MPKVIIVIVAIVIAAFLFMDSSKEPLPGSYHNEPGGHRFRCSICCKAG